MVRFLTIRTFALAMLVAPLVGASDNNFTYLALGDSIAFGLNVTLLTQQPPFAAPSQFVGYPERVADFERLPQSKEVNAACPGETSGSFLDVTAADNNCHGPTGFKALYGLHTSYTGSQMSFAEQQLATNKHINLVTLTLGGNDLILLQDACSKTTTYQLCVEQGLPGVLYAYGNNLRQILTRLRKNYQGTLIVVNSYAPSADPLVVEAIAALNLTMATAAQGLGVKFADDFTAFQLASALAQHDPCKAGLVLRLSPPFTNPPVCDVHPSPLGRDILALTVVITQTTR